MELPFSIHQEQWQECWLAATAAARSRKRQIDLDVSQRVERLLQEHGPATRHPLTLRVYGTMIKGFCVINNERARVLYADCQRTVVTFSQEALMDASKMAKLPPSKKPRFDALTLDLDLNKVKESESFDWTQAPLEDGALLRLQTVPEDQLATLAPPLEAPSLLEQVMLLDESFPEADVPETGPLELAAEAARTANTLEHFAVAKPVEPQPACQVPEQDELPAFEEVLMPVDEEEPGMLQDKPGRRHLRALEKLQIPGRVLGFDPQTMLASAEYESWQHPGTLIQLRQRGIADHVAALLQQAPPLERLGPLRTILDPRSEDLRMARTSGKRRSSLSLAHAPSRSLNPAAQEVLPEVQALLASEGLQSDMTLAVYTDPLEGLCVPGSGVPLAASRPDPFHPYSPEKPMKSVEGAAAELVELFGPGSAGGANATEPEECNASCAKYDPQTAKVAAVMRSYIAQRDEDRAATLDDVIPPRSNVDRASAARTFLAVLVLATSGELNVMQPMPYGPIALSLS